MYYTLKRNLEHFIKILLVIICLIILLTSFLYSYATDNDFANLPPKSKTKFIDDRYISLLYYNASVHGGLGDSMIYPISNFGKMYTSIYLIVIAAGVFTALDF